VCVCVCVCVFVCDLALEGTAVRLDTEERWSTFSKVSKQRLYMKEEDIRALS